jgi:hypothetical protein
MAKLTKGTQLYFVDPTSDAVTEITGVTTFNPGGAPSDQIETTTLTSEAKEFMRGMRTPGTATVEVNPDPTNASHVRLHELFVDDTVTSIPFAVGWSDGTVAPTESDGDFDQDPVARTFYYFDGYVADFPFDFSVNSVVKSSISIQRTGEATWVEST